jgi:hypothetical protein
MATHRRGLRPSQWPVRDLLGPADRGRLWDARIGAAVAGLLACSAAVTVVLTSGDTAASDAPPGAPQPGPLALPPPPAVDPAPVVPPALKVPPPAALPAPPTVVPVPPAPAAVVPVPSAPRHLAPSRPLHSVGRPASRPQRTPVETPAVAPARVPGPTLAEQIATGIEQWDDRSPHRAVAGWLLIPVQRPADAAALLELACRNCEQETGGGRHRAPDRDDVEPSPDRYREGGRHRAPDREDDRPQRYRSGHDRDERVEQGGDRAEERWDGSHRDENDGAAQDEDERSTPDRLHDGDEAPEDDAPEDEASDDDAERRHAADRDSSDEDEHDTQECLESDTDRSADD